MGRWGHRVFEGDIDYDFESEIQAAMRKKLKAKSVKITSKQLRDLLDNIEVPEHPKSSSSMTAQQLRELLDDSICEDLFHEYRAKEDDMLFGKYPSLILGAVMMKVGAKISKDNREYLRDVAEKTESHAAFRLPIGDFGFRDPGKAQFLAAVARHTDGEPRDLRGPSCFCCGLINKDLDDDAGELMRCGRCKMAWYCNKTCQKADWKGHKLICHPPGVGGLLNV